MPISDRACPAGAPPVTSLRPSRLATSSTGAPIRSPGTVMAAGGVPSLADAVLTASVADTATAASTAPTPRNRRRLNRVDRRKRAGRGAAAGVHGPRILSDVLCGG